MGQIPQSPQVPQSAGAPGEANPSGAGRRVGNYVLEERIGTGGMGLVFVARRDSDKLQVALKVLNPAFTGDAELVTRFQREANFMLALDHPHIVKAFEVGSSDDQHYLSMEYIPGENLKQRIVREGPVESVTALGMMRQVADALDYGARRGVIHRDLKPENILIRPDGVAKLADMGLAILVDRDDLRLTAAGFALGTPHYMSPEQARAERDLDTRCDIYSLGCTFYHAICGRPPFDGANPIVVIDQHLKSPPVPPTQLVPGLDQQIEAILLRCIEKDRASRFQSCAEIVQAIDRVLPAPAPAAPAAPAPPAEVPAPAAAAPAAQPTPPGPATDTASMEKTPVRRRTTTRRFEEAPTEGPTPAPAIAPPAPSPVAPAAEPGPPVPVPISQTPAPGQFAPPAAGGPRRSTNADLPPTPVPITGDGQAAPPPLSGPGAGGAQARVSREGAARGRGSGGLLLAKVLIVVILIAVLAFCGVLAGLIVTDRLHLGLAAPRADTSVAARPGGEAPSSSAHTT